MQPHASPPQPLHTDTNQLEGEVPPPSASSALEAVDSPPRGSGPPSPHDAAARDEDDAGHGRGGKAAASSGGRFKAKWASKDEATNKLSLLSPLGMGTKLAISRTGFSAGSASSSTTVSQMADEAAYRAAGGIWPLKSPSRSVGPSDASCQLALLETPQSMSSAAGGAGGGLLALPGSDQMSRSNVDDNSSERVAAAGPSTQAFSRVAALEGVAREALLDMADPKDARQRVTGQLAKALVAPGGVVRLFHELNGRCCRALEEAARPRAAVVLQLEAADVCVGREAFDEAHALLMPLLPRVLRDGWPHLVDRLYRLLLKCFDAQDMLLPCALLRCGLSCDPCHHDHAA